MVFMHAEERPVAVIQAGTAGIGLQVAHRLLSDGFAVVVSSRRQENVDSALASLSSLHAFGVTGNASSEADRKRLADAATGLRADGKIHALVCNAASSTAYGPLLKTTERQFSKMLGTNVLSGFLTVQEFDGRGAFAKDSSIVFVASIGAYVALPMLGAYSVTKTALLGLARALAEEMGAGEARVRVNCVAPGIIKTKFSEKLWSPFETADEPPRTGEDSSAKRMGIVAPLNRLGMPGDVAGVVAFLVSRDSAYVTGECVVCAGGMRSRL